MGCTLDGAAPDNKAVERGRWGREETEEEEEEEAEVEVERE